MSQHMKGQGMEDQLELWSFSEDHTVLSEEGSSTPPRTARKKWGQTPISPFLSSPYLPYR